MAGCVEQHCVLPGDSVGIRSKGDAQGWAAQFLTNCHSMPQCFKACLIAGGAPMEMPERMCNPDVIHSDNFIMWFLSTEIP